MIRRYALRGVMLVIFHCVTSAEAQPPADDFPEALTLTASRGEDCSCSDVLLQDKFQYERSTYTALAYLWTWNETKFNKFTEDMNHHGNVMYGPLLIDGTWNYSQFKESLDTISQVYKYDYTSSESISYLSTQLSPEAIAAWSDCIKNQCGSGVGARLKDTPGGDDKVATILVEWHPPGPIASQDLFVVVTNPGDPQQKPIKGKVSPNATNTFTLKRDSTKSYSARVCLGLKNGYLYGCPIIAVPKNAPTPPTFSKDCEPAAQVKEQHVGYAPFAEKTCDKLKPYSTVNIVAFGTVSHGDLNYPDQSAIRWNASVKLVGPGIEEPYSGGSDSGRDYSFTTAQHNVAEQIVVSDPSTIEATTGSKGIETKVPPSGRVTAFLVFGFCHQTIQGPGTCGSPYARNARVSIEPK